MFIKVYIFYSRIKCNASPWQIRNAKTYYQVSFYCTFYYVFFHYNYTFIICCSKLWPSSESSDLSVCAGENYTIPNYVKQSLFYARSDYPDKNWKWVEKSRKKIEKDISPWYNIFGKSIFHMRKDCRERFPPCNNRLLRESGSGRLPESIHSL